MPALPGCAMRRHFRKPSTAIRNGHSVEKVDRIILPLCTTGGQAVKARGGIGIVGNSIFSCRSSSVARLAFTGRLK